MRSIRDIGPLERGEVTELPTVIGAHPPEDVMHLASWIQLYTIIHAGNKPTEFECFPHYNGRTPELVRGRTYPLLGTNPEARGTITLYPEAGSATARITLGAEGYADWEIMDNLPITVWYEALTSKELMVAPLVYRKFAVFRDTPGSILFSVFFMACSHQPCFTGQPPYVAVSFMTDMLPNSSDDPQFLSWDGKYTLARSITDFKKVPFVDAHQRLVPLGTFILVKTRAITHFGINGPKQWVRGSLRYPEEDTNGDEICIYVTVIIKVRPGVEPDIRVIHTTPENCLILADSGVHEQDYTTDLIKQSVQMPSARRS